MKIRYSIQEAKARFSEVLTLVREGNTVTVSYRGVPMEEIRPIQRGTVTMKKRLDDLEQRGVLVRPDLPKEPLKPVACREGALERFLAGRGR